MPNWCDNIIYVRGADADLARLREQVFTNDEDEAEEEEEEEEETLDFYKIIAEPRYDDDMVYRSELFSEEATGKDCWYFCRIDHWGTKWEANPISVEHARDTLTIVFKTAWSPPVLIYLKVVTMFPDLVFEWYFVEPMMIFGGHWIGAIDVYGESDYDHIRCDIFGYDDEC